MAEGEEHQYVFNDILPLPFRICFLLQLGIYLWYALVWQCYKVYKMNVLALLNLSYSSHKYSSEDHNTENASGEFATTSTADLTENQILLRGINGTIKATLPVLVSGIAIHWALLVLTDPKGFLVILTSQYLPFPVLMYNLYQTFAYGPSMGQTRMSTTVKRILKGNINFSTMRTNDILISDSLTSYAKVVNDVGSFVWDSFVPTLKSYNVYVEVTVLSLPGLIRAKQCWYEFRLTRQKQHFYNLLKYLCGLGPILVNLLIKIKMSQLTEDTSASASLNTLNTWWYIISTISSTYSFIWDVRMDWGFGLFEPIFVRHYQNFTPLREPNSLIFKNYIAYFGVIIVDFFLRFIWVLKIYVIKTTEVELGLTQKVGSFLFGYDFYSFGFVVLEVLEILRRWLWCFFKLESDLVKLQARDDITHAIPLATVKA